MSRGIKGKIFQSKKGGMDREEEKIHAVREIRERLQRRIFL